ncbi:hypothetical protein CVT25_003357 [Psilocybe cyanescens]|uniref:Uncharacterized protein n=1 Tax=Psilocybe cyanescens TaxID=93625 RepID=A0A409XQP0_PSICY|nr:hypothetical protein CVT25_003357 [Psilocybe cyanescens]
MLAILVGPLVSFKPVAMLLSFDIDWGSVMVQLTKTRVKTYLLSGARTDDKDDGEGGDVINGWIEGGDNRHDSHTNEIIHVCYVIFFSCAQYDPKLLMTGKESAPKNKDMHQVHVQNLTLEPPDKYWYTYPCKAEY